jgi:hypothetical protein
MAAAVCRRSAFAQSADAAQFASRPSSITLTGMPHRPLTIKYPTVDTKKSSRALHETAGLCDMNSNPLALQAYDQATRN